MKRLLYILALLPGFVLADPDCGSTNPASPCTGTSHSDSVDGVTFTWSYTCDGGACQHGRFLDGTAWVRHASGGNVVISSVTPDDAASGLEKNPATGDEAEDFTQGLYTLSTSDATYSASQDISDELPFNAAADNGVYVKAKAFTGGSCGAGAVGNNCLETYDAMTVVVSVPDDSANGGNTFRPSMAGSTKLFVTKSDIDLTLLPRFSVLPAGNYTQTLTRWKWPYPDYYGGQNGDLGQRWTPQVRGLAIYAADRAEQSLNNWFGLFSTDAATGNKANAAYALLQYGIDMYGGYLEGAEWTGGAGQTQGRWHPIVMFGTLYNGASKTTVQNNIRAATANISPTNNGDTIQFTDLYQIRPNMEGIVIWGSFPGHDGCSAGGFGGRGWYWRDYSAAVSGNAQNKKTCGDPDAWIDGPGSPGSEYADCCSSGVYVTIGLLLKIWPEFEYVANNPYMRQYAERIMNGAGWWTQGDQCATRDPRELSGCLPYTQATANSTCAASGGQTLYFGKTWGPNVQSGLNSCVNLSTAASRGHPNPVGRWQANHLQGRPGSGTAGLDRETPGYQRWDTLSPRSGAEVSITARVNDDD